MEYDAILIDTSIYDGNALRLESGLLSKLKQFASSDIEFIVPDVIENEILTHLDKKIRISRNALEKAVNDASSHLFLDESALNDAKNLIVDSAEIEGLAKSRLEAFLTATNALTLECDSYVSVGEVLKKYFSNEAPFSETGKKKNEFPDAIILMAVEKWAEQECKSVLAVAKDNDWKSYCEGSIKIDYIDDLSKALSLFNTATAPFTLVEMLKESLNSSSAQGFLSKIDSSLELALSGFTPDQEAESRFYWEADGASGRFNGFEFVEHDFNVIDTDQDWVVLEGLADILVEADGEFSLSLYDGVDRDNGGMYSITVTAENEFQSEILITISGDLTGDINALEIEDVEVVSPINTIDFGELEPEFKDYY